jgi:hypothetical protein
VSRHVATNPPSHRHHLPFPLLQIPRTIARSTCTPPILAPACVHNTPNRGPVVRRQAEADALGCCVAPRRNSHCRLNNDTKAGAAGRVEEPPKKATTSPSRGFAPSRWSAASSLPWSYVSPPNCEPLPPCLLHRVLGLRAVVLQVLRRRPALP